VLGASLFRGGLRSAHLHDLRAGRSREHGGGLRGLLRHERDHLHRWRDLVHRDGVRGGLRPLHRDDVHSSGRYPGQARLSWRALLALVSLVPMGGMRQYVLHVVIQVFIWSFIGGAWALMARFGLVSLGHGAFLGLGAYTTTLLWNFYGVSPWLGAVPALLATAVLGVLVAYPCSRFRVV